MSMNAMKRSLMLVAFLCAPAWAGAHEHEHKGKGHEGMMKSMDANADGMISKDEFMKAHEAKWDELPKNKDGLVSLADMEKMHHEGMRKHEHAKTHDDMMKKEDKK
jgi:hypothetical protein